MSALSNNIQLIRGLLDMDQFEFGRLVLPGEKNGTSDPKQIKKIRSKISSYENGVAHPSFAVLSNIAAAGGVTIDQLTSRELTTNDIKIETNETKKTDKTENTSADSLSLIKYLKQELENKNDELKDLLKENALLKRDLEILQAKNLDFPAKRGKVG